MESDRHVIVLDVNVYLEVAALLGPPFSWEKFDARAAKSVNEDHPCHETPEVDSLRVIAMCTSGRFAGEVTAEVWTNAHIDGLVRSKASHPEVPAVPSGHRGLGWSPEDAQSLVDDLVTGITRRSSGGTLGANGVPDGDPPLDHEDGMVFGACRELVGDDPLCNVFCVTRDRDFVDAYKRGDLPDHTRVLTPPAMVALMRAARASISMKKIARPRSDP